MTERHVTHVIRQLAEAQHGIVSTCQLLAEGVSEDAVLARSRGGLLIPLFHGVFAVGHGRISRDGRWLAAVMASGPGAFLSHASAMALWGMRGSGSAVEVLRRSGGVHRARQGIRLHQTRRLPADHVTIERAIPVTTIERTTLDMAGRLDARQLERALVEADRSGRLRWSEMQQLVARGKGRKGIARLRAVVSQLDPRAVETRSSTEIDFLALCRESALPTPQVNVLVEGHLVDFLWSRQRVIVEMDSYTYHGDRSAFERDHERTVALTAAGYEVHRATRRMLDRQPELFLGLVRRALLRRQESRTASNFLSATPEI